MRSALDKQVSESIAQEQDHQLNNVPNDPRDIKLDIENMADVTIPELSHHLARPQIPYLHSPVIAGADEASIRRVERQSTHEEIMPDERSQTLTRGGRPNFYCAVIRA